ncbi:MAG: hypothetical protein C5B56_02430 [Proteobacteria bacterium]|nr:MAG: hypothetical protein C5B56_02430 [Pseudomonadota bacterium]
MALTEDRIRACASDEELFKALSEELHRRLPGGEDEDLGQFVDRLRRLPKGLRAMAAIYQLDVSLSLDDLGWHFANWHHRSYCDETLHGLRELEAHEAAEIFSSAYALAQHYWDKIGELLAQDFDTFRGWYTGSELETALGPLNKRKWSLCAPQYGLMAYWLSYARKYPENLVSIHDKGRGQDSTAIRSR